MSFYISGRPSFAYKDLFRCRKINNTIFPLNQENSCFYYSARYALASALKGLGITSGDHVLIPSYNCGVEIETVLSGGIKPVFYKVKNDLNADLDDVQNKIGKSTKAILLTHFLGFPQPIEKIKLICEERRLLLIEDCAHSLLSEYKGRPLGSFGDSAVFSLLKMLPVPNGGVLLFKNKKCSNNSELKKPNLLSTLFYLEQIHREKTYLNEKKKKNYPNKTLSICRLKAVQIFKLIVAGYRKLLNPKGLYLIRPDSFDFIDSLAEWEMSSISYNIISCTDFHMIKNRRRQNYKYLLKYFHEKEKDRLLFDLFPKGVCPLFFPILIKNSEVRQKLYNILKSKRVTTHPWWGSFHPQVPWEKFSNAVTLKQRLFGLPIHQDLEFRHIDRMIDEFEKALQQIEG